MSYLKGSILRLRDCRRVDSRNLVIELMVDVVEERLRILVTIIQFRPILMLAASPTLFRFLLPLHSGHKSPLWEDEYANESEKRNRQRERLSQEPNAGHSMTIRRERHFITLFKILEIL